MMTPGYELFDHTADIGIRVWAPSLPQLIRPATDGLYAVLGDLATGSDSIALTIEFRGDDAALLLRDYLAELLYLYDPERRRLSEVETRVFTPQHLVVTGQVGLVDAGRSVLAHEVKAVTYHELAIRPIPGGFEATYILDI